MISRCTNTRQTKSEFEEVSRCCRQSKGEGTSLTSTLRIHSGQRAYKERLANLQMVMI